MCSRHAPKPRRCSYRPRLTQRSHDLFVSTLITRSSFRCVCRCFAVVCNHSFPLRRVVLQFVPEAEPESSSKKEIRYSAGGAVPPFITHYFITLPRPVLSDSARPSAFESESELAAQNVDGALGEDVNEDEEFDSEAGMEGELDGEDVADEDEHLDVDGDLDREREEEVADNEDGEDYVETDQDGVEWMSEPGWRKMRQREGEAEESEVVKNDPVKNQKALEELALSRKQKLIPRLLAVLRPRSVLLFAQDVATLFPITAFLVDKGIKVHSFMKYWTRW